MPKMWVRAAVLLVAAACMCFLMVIPAGADPGAEAQVSLERAIGIAKGVFPVPAELTEFNSDYERSDEQGAVWHLRWYNDHAPGGSQSVIMSAENGTVLGFSLHRGVVPGTTYSGLPPYSREQALQMARDWAQKLQPERFAQTRLAPEPADFVPLTEIGSRDYPVTYSFHFQRLADGIPVNGEGITVQINGDTGELKNFNLNWRPDLPLPAAVGRISPEKARQIFDADGLELVYVYTGSHDRDTGERPYPVYAVRDGRFAVDALTGKVIGSDDDLYDLLEGGGMGGEARDEAAKELSPRESAQVEETKGLLSADEARRAAGKAYRLPGDAVEARSSLRPNWNVPGGKVWEFGYASEKAKAEINLRVDAKTGALLGLRVYERQEPEDYYKAPVVNFSEDQAREKALTFMRTLEPRKAQQVTLRDTRRGLGPRAEKGDPLPRTYNFSYARLVNGIPYPGNGFGLTVDSTTGEVTGYELNWWDVAIPPLQGVLDKNKVCADYLKRNPLTLEYARIYPRYGGDKPSYKLIYRLQDRADRMVDARSGQLLEKNGKPVTERAEGFSDIAGHPSEQEILLLLHAGIISGDGDKFRPDSPITNAELISMLVNAHGDRHRYPPMPLKEGAPWYTPSLARAVAMGIIDREDQYDPAARTSRLQAARMLVNAQGYGGLAKLSALFNLEAADAEKVPAGDRGYAAAAVGLDLLPLLDGRFQPEGGLTRGEMAGTLVRMLSR